VPRFEPVPCPKLQGVEWLAGANCGYLIVAEVVAIHATKA
jgi:hypothetical protein